MKNDYTFSKSGKMNGYGMGVSYEHVPQKDHSLLILFIGLILACVAVGTAVYLYHAGIVINL